MASIFQLFDPSIIPSLAFLFGIAAQFRGMGGNSLLQRIVGKLENRLGPVYAVFLVASIFSPFILNDVVILILTPVVVGYSKRAGVDPAPLLVAEITMTNVASSLTPLGNPQNILLWTASGAAFSQFVSGTWLQVLAGAAIAAAVLLPFGRRIARSDAVLPKAPAAPAVYLAAVAAIIFLSDFAGIPSYVSLAVGFLLGFAFTFRSPREVGRSFDARSLLTLYLFVVSVAAVSLVLKPFLIPLVAPVAEGVQPYAPAFLGLVSNFISNVPATQLVLSISKVSPAIASKIAVWAGFAGNISPLASFANILALQIARREGTPIRRTIALQFVVGILTFLPAFP